jgi:CP family cyanate transporter-like MFS transporter
MRRAGRLALAGVVGWVWGPVAPRPLWAVLFGSDDDVAKLTGGTLTIDYGVAFLGPLLGGALWDLTQVPALAFLPVGLAAALLIALGVRLPDRAGFGQDGVGAPPTR